MFGKAFSQNILIDAVRVRDYLKEYKNIQGKEGQKDDKKRLTEINGNIADILFIYYSDPENMNPKRETVINYFKEGNEPNDIGIIRNPFLSKNLAPFIANYSSDSSQAVATPSSRSIPGTSLSVATVVDGLTSFMIKRAQAEAGEYFLEQYADFVKQYPEVGHLLPESGGCLENKLKTYDFRSIYDTLPEFFRRDMMGLPGRVISMGSIETKDDEALKRIYAYKKLFETPFGFTARILNVAYEDIQSGRSVPALLDDIGASALAYGKSNTAIGEDAKIMLSYLRLLPILSNSLRNGSGDGWVTAEQITDCLEDPVSLQIYFGLLFERIRVASAIYPIKLSENNLDELMRENYLLVLEAGDLIANLGKNLSMIDALTKELAAAGSDPEKVKAIATRYIWSIGQFMSSATDQAAFAKMLGIEAKVSPFISSIRSALGFGMDIGRAISESDYSAAFASFIAYLDDIAVAVKQNASCDVDALRDIEKLKKEKEEIIRKIQDKEKLIEGSQKDIALNPKQIEKIREGIKYLRIDLFDKSKEIVDMDPFAAFELAIGLFLSKFKRFGGFAAAIASAKNAEDIEGILDIYALGPTSYRNKFNYGFSIALNSYLGANAAWDWGVEPRWRWPDTFGAHAPVGLAFSWSISKCFFSSFSAYIGLIDIGAVAAYRIQDDAAMMPDLELMDLFSLSGNLVFGIMKSPFSIGAGYRLGPALRSIDASGNKVLGANPWQLYFFAGIDIPLMSLYASPGTE